MTLTDPDAEMLREFADNLRREDAAPPRPKVVCLCGSTRFRREHEEAFRREEHAGRICLTAPCFKDDPCCKGPADHARLDELHLAKIDLADEVLVLNVCALVCKRCGRPCEKERAPDRSPCCGGDCRFGPYVGDSTRREIEYAKARGKPVRWLNQLEGE